jgi:hypothetical protein
MGRREYAGSYGGRGRGRGNYPYQSDLHYGWISTRKRGRIMSAINVKIEIEGNARKFIESLLEDYYYTIKGNSELLAQYETLKYKIEGEKE